MQYFKIVACNCVYATNVREDQVNARIEYLAMTCQMPVAAFTTELI